MKKALISKFFLQTIALLLGLVLSLIICWIIGESPIDVVTVLWRGAFGSFTNLGYTLFYATPLILTGLSVSWAFRLGLFNIGAEGQMTIGGVAMLATALYFKDLSAAIVIPLSMISGFVFGGLWALIAGWLRAYRGCHEVLATILLNYVSYGIVGYLILYPLRNVETQVPETIAISESLRLGALTFLGGSSPLNAALIVALIISGVFWILSDLTVFGFKQKLVGGSVQTARLSGINISKSILLGMFLSGGLAGIAGISEVFGSALKLREGFANGAGFMGIAVALLGRNHPVGIVLGSIMFGALQKGALDLDLDTKFISRDLALVIQGLVIMSVVSQRGLEDLWLFLKNKKEVKRG